MWSRRITISAAVALFEYVIFFVQYYLTDEINYLLLTLGFGWTVYMIFAMYKNYETRTQHQTSNADSQEEEHNES
jgi:hypothetical protein